MPVVQYSAGLGVMVALLLLGGIALFQPRNNSPRIVNVQPGAVGVAPTFSSGSLPAPVNYPAPRSFAPVSYVSAAMPPVNVAATMGPTPQQLEYEAIQRLRQVTAYTDTVVEQRRQERWEATRTAYQTGNGFSEHSGGMRLSSDTTY